MAFQKESKNKQDLSFISNNKPQQFKLIFINRFKRLIKISCVITGITGLVLLFSALQSYQTNRMIISTTGTIIELITTTRVQKDDNDKWRDITYYKLVIQFVDQQGQIQESPYDIGSSPPPYKKGDTVKILYDSRDPKLVTIEDDTFKHRNWLPLMLGILGLILILLVLLCWKIIKRKYN